MQGCSEPQSPTKTLTNTSEQFLDSDAEFHQQAPSTVCRYVDQVLSHTSSMRISATNENNYIKLKWTAPFAFGTAHGHTYPYSYSHLIHTHNHTLSLVIFAISFTSS